MEIKCLNILNKQKLFRNLYNIDKDSFQIIFYSDENHDQIKDLIYEFKSDKRTIFFKLADFSCVKKRKNKILQIIFDKNYFFQIIYETDLELTLSQIKYKNNFKSVFLISDIISQIEGQDFLFSLYSLFGFKKKYNGIVLKNDKNSCYFNGRLYKNYLLLIFFKKSNKIITYSDYFLPIEDKEFIINKSLNDGYSQINWMDAFDFYKEKLNIRSLKKLESKIKNFLLQFENIKNIKYFVKQYVNIELSTEQIYTDIAIHTFQFCKLVMFDEKKLVDIINKIEVNKTSLIFIDRDVFKKVSNFIHDNLFLIPADIFIVQKNNQLPFLTQSIILSLNNLV